jgi:hypothetical protein
MAGSTARERAMPSGAYVRTICWHVRTNNLEE